MSFDPTKPVQTRGGFAAVIIHTEAAGDHPIVALVEDNSGHQLARMYTSTGIHGVGPSNFDLVNIPEEPKLRPWKLHEIPIGALGRCRGETRYSMIVNPCLDHCTDLYATQYEWCWPHEQFENKWRPCGVVE